MIGWGGFTWKRAEEALTQARAAALGEMKDGMKYLTERVDYHVSEQASESRGLKNEVERLRRNSNRHRIDD